MTYNKILLKLSGESLGGPDGQGLDAPVLSVFAHEIKLLTDAGVKVALVVGGGNLFRGLQGVSQGFDRVNGDQIGMLATVMNSLALAGTLRATGVRAQVYTSVPMPAFAPLFQAEEVREAFEKGTVVLLAGGTGNPFFTTDSAAALRALELKVDAVLKGTRVDGVYTADPEKDPTAVKYDKLTFDQVLDRQLRIMDQTAFTLCKENNMPIVVFNMNQSGNALRVAQGAQIGTLISNHQ